MPHEAFAYFRNSPGKSRFARTSSFCIFTTDFRPRMQSYPLHFPANASAPYSSGNPRIHPRSDPAQRDRIPGLKENT
jgi:hypothetical protein